MNGVTTNWRRTVPSFVCLEYLFHCTMWLWTHY